MEWFRRNNRKLRLVGFSAWGVLSLYLLTLVAAPMLHTHGCEHSVKTCCEDHSAPASGHVPAPYADDSCPVCEFARLVTPFFTISESLMRQADIVDGVCVTVSMSSVVYATALPPCRAPPVV